MSYVLFLICMRAKKKTFIIIIMTALHHDKIPVRDFRCIKYPRQDYYPLLFFSFH
jgi:hypothetical protein